MAVKKTDYIVEKGIEPVKIKRPVKINDKSQNLTIDLKLNHKKGLYEIRCKWNFEKMKKITITKL